MEEAKIVVTVFSDAINAAVLKLPSRRFPGLLLQGDTLKSLYDLAVEASKSEKSGELIEEIADRIEALCSHYERSLRFFNHELPYPESQAVTPIEKKSGSDD